MSEFQTHPALAGFERRLEGRVEVWVSGGVAVIGMNRPEKRNAIDMEQVAALEAAVDMAVSAPDIRAVVLAGAGPAFCAGGDIAMFRALTPDNALAFTRRGHAMLNRLEHGPRPVIAAVNGPCVAGGLELALACDFIVAGQGARLGLAEVSLGLIPGWGGTVRIARALPLRLARQIVLTAELIPAERARDVGLVNEVVAEDAVLPRALELARTIAGQPQGAVEAARRVMNAAGDGPETTALELEASWAANLFPTSDVRERVAAWVARRRT